MSAPLYTLRGLVKNYGQRIACSVPSLDIAQGEVLAVVGPNGAGKSTLMRLLALVEQPSSGAIMFDGHRIDAARRPPLVVQRRVAMVFQRPLLLDASVLQNAAYGLWLRGRPNARVTALKALEALGIAPLAGRHIHTLSGGELQRVALARAIVLEPAALILDEPASNLDPQQVASIEAAISAASQRGTTVVLVTHNLFQARRLAHRAMLLLNGTFVEVAPTQQFFRSPADPRTQAFVQGEMVY